MNGSMAPRAFISYSWESEEHQNWVNSFATRFQGESGVELIFDQWHLRPGDDKLHFMERAVANSDFVIVVCTRSYAERANERQGGVGYESMVITAELAEKPLKGTFIPVLRAGEWRLSSPLYLKSKMGVDLTGEPYSEKEYEKLLRVLHGQHIQPPPIGTSPTLSKKPNEPSKPSTPKQKDSSEAERRSRCDFSPRALILLPERSTKAFPVVHEIDWSKDIRISVVASSSEIDSLFSGLRGNNGDLVFAYGFDVAIAKLKSLKRHSLDGRAVWDAEFTLVQTDFKDEMEMGTSTITADEFAEKRARRILLNENSKKSEGGVENNNHQPVKRCRRSASASRSAVQ